jgi:hypothetical protein
VFSRLASKFAMRLESAGWVMCRRSAARVNDFSSLRVIKLNKSALFTDIPFVYPNDKNNEFVLS